MPTRIYRLFLFATLCLFVGLSNASNKILVVVPNKPFLQKIYQTISRGIQKQVKKEVESQSVSSEEELQALLTPPLSYEAIVSLSPSLALNIKQNNYSGYWLTSNWMINPKNQFNGISTAIDSRIIARKLEVLIPHIKRLHVIQSAIEQIWINKLSSRTLILKNHIEKQSNKRLKRLVKLIENIPNEDAILIPYNIEPDLLYRVAEIAWDTKRILISNNPAHLETGVMLCFFVDFFALGEQVGQYIQKKKQTVEPTKHVLTGLNQKVARHLGITLIPSQRKSIDIVMP